MLNCMISLFFVCVFLSQSVSLLPLYFWTHCKEKHLSFVFDCVRARNVKPNWINGITDIALNNAPTNPSHTPPPSALPSHHPISVLAAFFSLLCSLIFQQLQGQSNGPFKFPASCIWKKEIMSSSSAGKCSRTKVPSRASPADVFLLKSLLGELDLFVWAWDVSQYMSKSHVVSNLSAIKNATELLMWHNDWLEQNNVKSA